MPTVHVSAPGLPRPVALTLCDGEVALLGRNPDPAAPRPACVPPGPARAVAVASARVSENHAWAWCVGAEVFVCDNDSRNGTRLALAPAAPARAAGPLELELAPAARAPREGPAAVDWESDEDFRANVVGAVDRWLDDERVGAAAALVRCARDEDVGPAHVPLGGGWFVELRDPGDGRRRTENPRVATALDAVWRYVHDMRGRRAVERDSGHDDLVLASAAIRRVHRRVRDVAARGLNAILLGESGVGKSALAGCFHAHSERRNRGEFVATNLGEDSDDPKYLQKKLFGAKRGASAHVDRDEVGLVRRADGGVLFLDEVAQLSPENQAMLLRFLDTGRYRRLGESGEVVDQHADVRVVVGTNADLRALVRERRFREDLWHRLAGEVIEIPPLRERRDDIAAYLRAASLSLPGRDGSVFDLLAPDARQLLVHGYDWPGNFRALAHLVRRLPLYAEGDTITRRDCEEALAAVSLEPPRFASPEALASVPSADASSWADLLPTAWRAFPHWMKTRPPKPTDPPDLRPDATPSGAGYRVFLDEVLRPLCMARALGVERWDELPKRPDPSYQAMAERLGYGDGRSVQDGLRTYVALKKIVADLDR
ncbi:MAG: sigma 54-interacting transcriptional regulator [Polyangiales bacterium]